MEYTDKQIKALTEALHYQGKVGLQLASKAFDPDEYLDLKEKRDKALEEAGLPSFYELRKNLENAN